MLSFAPTSRAVFAQGLALGAASWLGLRVIFALSPEASLAVAVSTLGAFLGVKLARSSRSPRLEARPEALVVVSDARERKIPWAAIDGITLAMGDVSTGGGTVRVCYALLDVAHGPPVAFSDLSALQALPIRTPDGATRVLDLGDPELLLGVIAERTNTARLLPPERDEAPIEAPDWRWRLLPSTRLVANALGLFCVFRQLALGASALPNQGHRANLAAALVAVLPWGLRWLLGGTFCRPAARFWVAALTTLVAVGLLGAGADRAVAVAWALVLPVSPFPGAAAARWLGRALARVPAAVIGAALGAFAMLVGWLFARGATAVPVALLAGAVECSWARDTALRARVLTEAPRFARWSAESIARLRALLRPLHPDDDEAPMTASDVAELEAARAETQRDGAPSVALAGVSLAALVFATYLVWYSGAELDAVLAWARR